MPATPSPAGPEMPVAYKYADPTEDERFIYDEHEAQQIAAEDPSLIVRPSSPRWNLVTRTLRAADGARP